MPKTSGYLPVPQRPAQPRRGVQQHRLRRIALAVAWLGVAPASRALPEGAAPSFGQTSVSTQGRQMTIVQGTDRAGIDWRSFSVGAGEAVRVLQPGASATLFNRVLSADPSQILGSIDANGRLVLINPNGILFGRSATLNVGSLVASTLSLSDEAMRAGRFELTRGLQTPGALVQQGHIEASGTVALVAPQVEHSGSISAPRIGLAAAERVKVDLDGTGLIFFNIANETLDARLKVAGTLAAAGGVADLRAQARAGVTDTVLNLEGVVMARGVGQRNGRVFIDGGTAGITDVRGTVDATSAEAGAGGGEITVLGDKVGLFGSALLDASGAGGGGTVLVGGNFQGRGPERNAAAVYVGPEAGLRADAGDQGAGGRIVVWSDVFTRFQGGLSARGGLLGGDGGFAEISSRERFDVSGTADVGAPRGSGGTLVLDPRNLTIRNDPLNLVTDRNPFQPENPPSPGDLEQPAPPDTGSVLSWATVKTALETNNANVLVSTRNAASRNDEDGTITVVAPPAQALGGSGTLTLEAAGAINVDAGFARPGGGGLVLRAGKGITVASGQTLGSTATGDLLIWASEGAAEDAGGAINVQGSLVSGGSIALRNDRGSLVFDPDASADAVRSLIANVAGDITIDAQASLVVSGAANNNNNNNNVSAMALQATGSIGISALMVKARDLDGNGPQTATPLDSLILRASSLSGGGGLPSPVRLGLDGTGNDDSTLLTFAALHPTSALAVANLGTTFNRAVGNNDLRVAALGDLTVSVAGAGRLSNGQGVFDPQPVSVTGISGIQADTVRLQAGGKILQDSGALIRSSQSGGVLLRSGSSEPDAIVLTEANQLQGTLAVEVGNGGGVSINSVRGFQIGGVDRAPAGAVVGNTEIAAAAGVRGAGDAAAGAIALTAAGAVTQDAAVPQVALDPNRVQGTSLTLGGVGSWLLNNAANNVDTVTVSTGAGAVGYRNVDGFSVNQVQRAADVTLVAATGNLTLAQPVNIGTNTLRLNAVAGDGDVSQAQSATITAGKLGARAGGSVTLTEANVIDDADPANNTFGTVAGRAGNGVFKFRNIRDTVVGSVGDAAGDASLFASATGVEATKAQLQAAATSNVTLRVQGQGSDLAITSPVSGETVRLVAASGAIAQAASDAAINATAGLSAFAGGGSVVLPGNNSVVGNVAARATGHVGINTTGNLTVGPVSEDGAAPNQLAPLQAGITAGDGQSIALVSGAAMTLNGQTLSAGANGSIGLQAASTPSETNTTLTAGTVLRRVGSDAKGVSGKTVAANLEGAAFGSRDFSLIRPPGAPTPDIEVGEIPRVAATQGQVGPVAAADGLVQVLGVSGIRASTVLLDATQTGGAITQTHTIVATTALGARATGNVLLGLNNEVGNSTQTANGTVALQAGGNVLFKAAAYGYTIGKLAVSNDVFATGIASSAQNGTVELITTSGTVQQDANLAVANAQVGVRASKVLLDGAAGYQLTRPGNSAATLAIASSGLTEGQVSFVNEGALNVAKTDRLSTPNQALAHAVQRGADVNLRAETGNLNLVDTVILRSPDQAGSSRFTLRLQAPGGDIGQSAAITALAVGASASGSVSLTAANDVDDAVGNNDSYGTVAGRAGSGDFRFINTRDTRVHTVAAAAGTSPFDEMVGVQATSQITLRLTGDGNDLAIERPISAGPTGTVRLESAGGSITMGADPNAPSMLGVITAQALGARAAGSIRLTAANVIDDADEANAVSGRVAGRAGSDIRIVNTRDTAVASVDADPVNAQWFASATELASTTGSITLSLTGAGHDLALGQAVSALAGTVRLSAAGDITQTAAITALALGARAGGSVTLTAANQIDDSDGANDTFGTVAGLAGNGNFRLLNQRDTVVGLVDDDPVAPALFTRSDGVTASKTAPTATNNVTLRVEGAGNDLAIVKPISGETLRLVARQGSVLQAASGARLVASAGLGAEAGQGAGATSGSVVLPDASNSVGGALAAKARDDVGIRAVGPLPIGPLAIGSVEADGGLFSALTSTSAGGNLVVSTTGELQLGTAINANRVGLVASSITGQGTVSAATSEVRRTSGLALAVQGNTVAAVSASDFNWVDKATVVVGRVDGITAGPASAGPVSNVLVDVAGVSGIQAQTVRLRANAGSISQTEPIAASVALGAVATGDITLGAANTVGSSLVDASGTVALQAGGNVLFNDAGNGYTIGRVLAAGLPASTFAAGIVSTAAEGKVELSASTGLVAQDQQIELTTADVGVRAKQLLLRGGAAYTLTLESNAVGVLAASTGAGTLRYVDKDALEVGSVTPVGGTSPGDDVAGITRSGDVALRTVDGDLSLKQGIDVSSAAGKRIELELSKADTLATQDAKARLHTDAAGQLLLRGEGGFTLADAGNDVGVLAASAGAGTLRYVDANALEVGTVRPVGSTSALDDVAGITRSGPVALRTLDGKLEVTGPVSLGTKALRLQAAGAEGDVLGGGTIKAGELGVVASRDIKLSSQDNAVATLAMDAGRDLLFSAAGGYKVTEVVADSTLVGNPAAGAPVVFNGATGLRATGLAELITRSGEVTQDKAVVADKLLLRGEAAYTLTQESNAVGVLAASTGAGTLRYVDKDVLEVGSITPVGGTSPRDDVAGITRRGDVALRTVNGNLSLKQGIDVSSAAGKRIELELSKADTLATQDAKARLHTDAAGQLLLRGEGGFTLADAGNDVGVLAASAGAGTLRYVDANALEVGTVRPVGSTSALDDVAGITRSGPVALRTLDGKLEVTGPVSLGTKALRLQAAGAEGDVLGGGTIKAGELGVVASRDIKLSSQDNAVATLAMDAGRDLLFSAAGGYKVTEVVADSTLVGNPAAGAPVVFNGATGLRATGLAELNTRSGEVTQDKAVVADKLLLRGEAAYTLTLESNAVRVLAASDGAGTLRYADKDALEVGSITPVGGTSPRDDVAGITRSGHVALRTVDGNLSLARGINVAAAADKTVELEVAKAGRQLSQQAGQLVQAGSSGALVLRGDGDVALVNAGNDVGSLSIAAGSGAIAYVDRDAVKLAVPAVEQLPTGVPLDAAIAHAGPVFLRAGAQVAGDLVLDGNVTMPTSALGLQASGSVSQSSGVITAGTLGARAGQDVLLGAVNRIGLFAATAGTGSVWLRQADGYLIDALAAGGGSISGAPVEGRQVFEGVDGVQAPQGTLELITRAGTVRQSRPVGASDLLLRGDAAYELRHGDNAVTTLAADTGSGVIHYVDKDALSLARVPDASVPSQQALPADAALSRTGPVWVRAGGTLTLAGNVVMPTTTLGLQAGNSVTQTGGTINADALGARAETGSVTLDSLNKVGTFAATAAGNVYLREADGYTIAEVGPSPLTVSTGADAGQSVVGKTMGITAGSTIELQTQGGDVTQGVASQEAEAATRSALTASNLLLQGAAAYSLLSTANQVGNMAFRLDSTTPASSELQFFNTGKLTLKPFAADEAPSATAYTGFTAPVNAVVRATGVVSFDGTFVATSTSTSTAPAAAPARFRVESLHRPGSISDEKLKAQELNRYLVSQAEPTQLITPRAEADGKDRSTPIGAAGTALKIQDDAINQANGSTLRLSGGVTLDLQAAGGGSITLANQGNDFGGANFTAGAIVARSAQTAPATRTTGVLSESDMQPLFDPSVSLAAPENGAYTLSRVQLAASNIVIGKSSGGAFAIDEYEGLPNTEREGLQAGVEADLVRLRAQRISTAGVAQDERNFVIGRYYASRGTNFEFQLPGLVLSLQLPEGEASSVPRYGAVSSTGQPNVSGLDLQAAAKGEGPGLNVAVGVPSLVNGALPAQAGWILIDPNTRRSGVRADGSTELTLGDVVQAYAGSGGLRISLSSPVERDDQGLLLAVGKDFLGSQIAVLTNLVDSTSVAAASAIRGVAELQEAVRRDQIERSVTSESVARDLREVVIVETRMSPPATTGTQGLRPPASCQPGAGQLGCGPATR